MRETSFVLIAFVVGCTAGDDLPAPIISAITPDHAAPGVSVSIEGDYLCQQQETGDEDPLACAHPGTVSFGQTPGSIDMYAERLIMTEVPELEAGRYALTVSAGGRRSNSLSFTVDPL